MNNTCLYRAMFFFISFNFRYVTLKKTCILFGNRKSFLSPFPLTFPRQKTPRKTSSGNIVRKKKSVEALEAQMRLMKIRNIDPGPLVQRFSFFSGQQEVTVFYKNHCTNLSEKKFRVKRDLQPSYASFKLYTYY